MESQWESACEEYEDVEDSWAFEECPMYQKLQDCWDLDSESEFSMEDLCISDKTRDWLEESLLEHGGTALGIFDWKRSHGRPVYFLRGECLEEACSWDHVREEHRMTFGVPMAGAYPGGRSFDRNTLIPYHWVVTNELATLHRLLSADSDFIRIQSLSCIKHWATSGQLKKFSAEDGIIPSIARLILTSNHCGVMRMAACVISLVATSPKLRQQFLTHEGASFLHDFFKIVTGQIVIKDDGSRWLIAKALSEMTTNDLAFTGYLIRNLKLESLFLALNYSTSSYFKMNILTLLSNVLQHPLGLEKLTSLDDFQFEPLLKAFSSLVPKFQKAGFYILDSILKTPKPSLQTRLHEMFVKDDGLLTVMTVLEEVFDIEKNLALQALTLLDHLADSDVGRHALITTALNMLTSIVYLKGSSTSSRIKSRRMLSPPFSAMRIKKSAHTIPESIVQGITESKRIDEYNASESKIYAPVQLPLDYSFLDENEQDSYDAKKEIAISYSKVENKVNKSSPNKLSRRDSTVSTTKAQTKPVKDPPVVRLTEKRIRRKERNGDRNLLDLASRCIDRTDQETGVVTKVDNNVRLLAMEVLSKLASHRLGAKLLTGLVRNLCPVLRRYAKETNIAESAGFCIQLVSSKNYKSLQNLLPHYYLIRELAEVLNIQLENRVTAAIFGALATLLKQSCRLVYTMAGFSIRKPLLQCLSLIPNFPDYASLYVLVFVHSLSRYYKRRDFVISKTVVNSLFNILQDERTAEMCRIYAATSLALLTLGNKRYRKLGSDAFSIKKQKLVLRYSLPEKQFPVEDEDTEEEVPSSTLESFKACQIQEAFFERMYEMSSSCAVNTFHLFLMNVLLNRAIVLWSNIVIRHLDIILKWLTNCLKDKTSLSGLTYSSLMENMPTLSFYMQSRVSPWSKIDQQPFYVCVDPDLHGNFTDFLANNEGVCPIYTVYRLSKTDPQPFTPWDIYWRERYDPLRSSPFVADSFKSVIADSMFGMGGTYREDGGVPYTVTNTISRRYLVTDTQVRCCFKYEDHDRRDDHPVPIGAFGAHVQAVRRPLPDEYMRRPYTKIVPRRILVPSYGNYISCLTRTPKKEAPVPSSIARIVRIPVNKSVKKRLKKSILMTLSDYYKKPEMNFTNYQLKLLMKALGQSEETKDTDSCVENVGTRKVKKRGRFQTVTRPFPNCALKGLATAVFNNYKTLKSLDIVTNPKDQSKEVADIIASVILFNFEKLSSIKSSFPVSANCPESSDQIKPIPFLSPPSPVSGRSVVEHPKLRSMSKSTLAFSKKESSFRKTILSSDYDWFYSLGAYGRAFVDFFYKPYSENLARSLLRYSLDPNEILQSRRGTATSKSKATFSRFTPSVFKLEGSVIEKNQNDGSVFRTATLDSHLGKAIELGNANESKNMNPRDVRRDGSQGNSSTEEEQLDPKTGKGDRSVSGSPRLSNLSVKARKTKPTIDDVYVPTRRELVLDFFTQPQTIDLRRPFSRSHFYTKDRGKTFLGKISETFYNKRKDNLCDKFPQDLPTWGNFINDVNLELSRRVYNALIGDQLERIRNIDYQGSGPIIIDVQNEDTTKDLSPNLEEFCQSIKKQIQEIFERDFRVSCWYSDVISLLGRKVCLRLEGPFGYVNDYLMRHHRKQLRRLLGTSVIPMGCLRVGGQLERAILFKFLADQLMIPCFLRRESISRAFVEVPVNPFLYPPTETCLVDLEDVPGEMIRKGARKAEPIPNRLTFESTVGDFFIEEDFEDQLTSYLEKKRRVLRDLCPKVDKPSVFATDQSRSEILQTPTKDVIIEDVHTFTWEVDENAALEPCTNPLAEQYFIQKDDIQDLPERLLSPEKIQPKRMKRSSGSPTCDPTQNLLKNFKNERFLKYSWKDDPNDKYALIIGRVPDTAFFTKLTMNGVLSVAPESEDTCYTTITSRQLIGQLQSSSSLFPYHQTMPVIPSEDAYFSDEQCNRWLNNLLFKSNDEPEEIDEASK